MGCGVGRPKGGGPRHFDSRLGRAELHARNLVKASLNYRGERRSIARQYQFAALRHFTPTLVVKKDGITYFVDAQDNVVGRITYACGAFEQDYMDLAIQLARKYCGDVVSGKTMLDIGANIGTSTIPALLRYGAARVVAFEPSPENCYYLRINVAANGLDDRVDIRQVALSNREGKVDLELSDDNWGDHRVRVSVAKGRAREERRATIEVSVQTLADAGLESEDVGLIWMDVQGHEGHVLAGAAENLHSVPVVTEYWPYALHRAGGLALMNDVIRSRYDSVVDIRATIRKGHTVSFSAESVERLASEIQGDGATDLLLLP